MSKAKPKWQRQVEQILRAKYVGPELSEIIEHSEKLSELAIQVPPPSGRAGKVVALMMKEASRELKPLAAVYAGFSLGVAWERYQREQKEADRGQKG